MTNKGKRSPGGEKRAPLAPIRQSVMEKLKETADHLGQTAVLTAEQAIVEKAERDLPKT